MGLLSFAKSVGAKIFGVTETTAAPPDRLQKEIEEHGIDVSEEDDTSEDAEKLVQAQDNSVAVVTLQDDQTSSDNAPESVETEADEAVLSGNAASPAEAEDAQRAIDNFPDVGTAKEDLPSSDREPQS